MEVSPSDIERSVRRSTTFGRLVRCGLAAYGLLHLVVAWVAIRLVWGHAHASTQGALGRLAGETWGVIALVLLAIGFSVLTVWQAVVACVGFRDDTGRTRVVMRLGAVCRTVTYGYLALSLTSLVLGSHGSGRSPRSTSAGLLAEPLGRLLLGAGGFVVIAIGVGLALFGIRRGFEDQLDHEARQGARRLPIVALGQAGYVAKGIAFGIVGGLACWAALTDDPSRAGGLDQSLEHLVRVPLGIVAVCAIALGIGCFGLYLLARARHLAPKTLTA
jgi:hypothetical protein